MKKIIILMAFLLSACASVPSTPQPTPTPNAGEIALNMMQKQLEAQATGQAVGLQFTATAAVIGATSTAQQVIEEGQMTQQARQDAQATAEQDRANAQATAEQKRADIAATQQRMDMESTQSAGATAVWDAITMTAMPPAATMTAIANAQIIAMGNNELKKSDLEVEQQRQKNTVEWMVPFAIALMAAVVGALVAIRYSRTREIRDEDGGVQVLVMDNKTVLSPRLLAGPVLDMTTMSMPQLVAPEEQIEVTKRAQTVEALKAMPTEPARSAMPLFGDVFNGERKPRFETLGSIEQLPAELLNPETLKSIEGDWKENNDE